MKEAFLNIRRTPFQSLSVYLLQFFGAFLLLVSIASTATLIAIFSRIEVQIPVIVYFKPDTKESAIFTIRESLLTSGKVSNIEYVSKKSAYDFYKAQNKDNPLLLEMTSVENFPASLNIQASRPEYLRDIASSLKKYTTVDEVQFEKETTERLIAVTDILRISILVLASYLAVMTFITVVTMVMFKIALRKDEIELNRLLGATSGRITKPFFEEGNILSVSAVLSSFALFLGILFVARGSFSSYLNGIGTLTLPIQKYQISIWPLSPITLLILFAIVLVYMLFLSVLATKVATKKYI